MADENKPVQPSAPATGANPAATPHAATTAAAKPAAAPRPAAAPIPDLAGKTTNAASPGGVFGFLGTSMLIRDAVISNNVGFGLVLSLKSGAQISSSTIQNNLPVGPNPGDGIRLVFGSGLFLAAPNSTVTANTGWGLNCTDGESSVINTIFLTLGGNTLGGVSPSCTGF